MKDYIPQKRQDVILFFQMSDLDFDDEEGVAYIEQVVWAIDEYGESNFKRFCTSYETGSKTELMERMKNRTL